MFFVFYKFTLPSTFLLPYRCSGVPALSQQKREPNQRPSALEIQIDQVHSANAVATSMLYVA